MEECLVEVGLTKNEARVYWKLLTQGSGCVRSLARECKLYRSSVYDVLDQLAKKGLVSFIWKDQMRFYEAISPEGLVTWIQDKECRARQLLPRMKLEVQLKKEVPSRAAIVEGVSAFRYVLFGWLKKKSPILVYGIPRKVPEIVRYFIDLFHQERIRRRILMRHIYNLDALNRIQYLNRLPCTEAKCLPKAYSSPTTTMVCKDEIALISWEPLTVIQVRSEALAQAYQNYFEILWAKARKPKRSNEKIRRK